VSVHVTIAVRGEEAELMPTTANNFFAVVYVSWFTGFLNRM
jgi:hypothetical protein